MPCARCDLVAHTGRHEPYLVDDVAARLRLWRCSRCATLWLVTERAVVPTTPERADALLPGWRARERWLASTPLPEVLAEAAIGRIDADRLVLAVLHHDLLVGPTTPRGVGYSSSDAAARDGLAPDTLRVVPVAEWMRRVAVAVFDPAGPHRQALSPEQQHDLDHAGGGVVTDADPVRDHPDDR